MVKYLIILLPLFFGCETNSKQIIKPEKFTYDIAKFNSVSKSLYNEFKFNSTDHQIISDIIQYWFDNRIKTNGFDGDLHIHVRNINFNREKKQDYYKFSVLLTLEFIEQKSSISKKVYKINSNEYGEISGSFSIKDQENLDINIMHKSFENISLKLKELN